MILSTIAPEPPKTRVVVDGDKVSFVSPYPDQWFVEDLTKEVPPAMRRWDHRTSTWTVPVEYLDFLVELVKVSFGREPEIVR